MNKKNSSQIRQYLSKLHAWMNRIKTAVSKKKKHLRYSREITLSDRVKITFFSLTKEPLNDFALAFSHDTFPYQYKNKSDTSLRVFILNPQSFPTKQLSCLKNAMWFFKDLGDKKLSCKLFTSAPLLSYFLLCRNKPLIFMGPDSDMYIFNYNFKYLWPYIEFITFCVTEIRKKQRRRLTLHAATMVRKNKIILIIGKSGIGKTTLATRLVREKFFLINDDAAYLKKRGTDFFYCFTEYFLKNIPQFILDIKQGKNEQRLFRMLQSYMDAKVRLMLFLERAKDYATSVQEVKGTAELIKKMFMENSVAVAQKKDMGEKLELLLCLFDRTNSYRIFAGRDIFTKDGIAGLVKIIDGIL